MPLPLFCLLQARSGGRRKVIVEVRFACVNESFSQGLTKHGKTIHTGCPESCALCEARFCQVLKFNWSYLAGAPSPVAGSTKYCKQVSAQKKCQQPTVKERAKGSKFKIGKSSSARRRMTNSAPVGFCLELIALAPSAIPRVPKPKRRENHGDGDGIEGVTYLRVGGHAVSNYSPEVVRRALRVRQSTRSYYALCQDTAYFGEPIGTLAYLDELTWLEIDLENRSLPPRSEGKGEDWNHLMMDSETRRAEYSDEINRQIDLSRWLDLPLPVNCRSR